MSVVLALKDVDRSDDPAFQNFALRLYEENVDEFRDISRVLFQTLNTGQGDKTF